MTIKGQNDEQQRYVTAHVDTLGAIVRAVKPGWPSQIGPYRWFPWNMIEGENCTVHVASTGEKYQEPSSSTKLLAMSTRMQELQNVRKDNMEVRLDQK